MSAKCYSISVLISMCHIIFCMLFVSTDRFPLHQYCYFPIGVIAHLLLSLSLALSLSLSLILTLPLFSTTSSLLWPVCSLMQGSDQLISTTASGRGALLQQPGTLWDRHGKLCFRVSHHTRSYIHSHIPISGDFHILQSYSSECDVF